MPAFDFRRLVSVYRQFVVDKYDLKAAYRALFWSAATCHTRAPALVAAFKARTRHTRAPALVRAFQIINKMLSIMKMLIISA